MDDETLEELSNELHMFSQDCGYIEDIQFFEDCTCEECIRKRIVTPDFKFVQGMLDEDDEQKEEMKDLD